MFWQKEGFVSIQEFHRILRQHLNECQIDCNENQIPIEVLIKLSFKGMSDKNVRQLMQTTNKSKISKN